MRCCVKCNNKFNRKEYFIKHSCKCCNLNEIDYPEILNKDLTTLIINKIPNIKLIDRNRMKYSLGTRVYTLSELALEIQGEIISSLCQVIPQAKDNELLLNATMEMITEINVKKIKGILRINFFEKKDP